MNAKLDPPSLFYGLLIPFLRIIAANQLPSDGHRDAKARTLLWRPAVQAPSCTPDEPVL
jgi:hypothetical protein